jgi:hypothetical protein
MAYLLIQQLCVVLVVLGNTYAARSMYKDVTTDSFGDELINHKQGSGNAFSRAIPMDDFKYFGKSGTVVNVRPPSQIHELLMLLMVIF